MSKPLRVRAPSSFVLPAATYKPSLRAEILTRRTYNRPLNAEGTVSETWEQTVQRVLSHQQWLWERALNRRLNEKESAELIEFGTLMIDRKVSPAGRTLWLGGTEIARAREASQFNCSALRVETVYDIVDSIWLLLQGCGVGFQPMVGTLHGYPKPLVGIDVIRSERTMESFQAGERGVDHNTETFDAETGVWTIQIGDSAEAWAKAVGKLVAGKYPARRLVLDLTQIRPAGLRLKGYGWISSGDESISTALPAIAKILSRKAGNLLSRIDIIDIMNWLGTVLSSRRSAEIAVIDFDGPEWKEFATMKREFWVSNPQRAQSNNSLLFWNKPTRAELQSIFDLMLESGGSEPGFINAKAAQRRAPWFSGVNPCVEILLGNRSFCNLVETDCSKFKGDSAGLHRAIELAARANYRQTCVDLRDGILQEAWHLNNEFLHLCGVSLTGLTMRPDLSAYDFQSLQRVATFGAYSMADELDRPRPRNVTCVKPSGTIGKIFDCPEGIHKPLGRYIFNNVMFSEHDPLVSQLRAARYTIIPHPNQTGSVIVTLPVRYDEVPFDHVEGKEVNLDSAVDQLERYRLVQENWCQQNVSNTISYSPDEVPAILDWFMQHWDSYVGVSFLFRNDPTKTAKDLGYLYLPQEVVTKEIWEAYSSQLLPVNLQSDAGEMIEDGSDCAGGACPIR